MNGTSKYAHDFDANNWGPRLGFAWRATNGLVVRGGYGVFHNGTYQVSVNNNLSQGFSINGSFTSPDGGFTPPFLFRDGVPAITRTKLGPEFGAVPVGRSVTTAPDFIAQDHVNGYSQQWNLTIQKELPGAILFESAYIANVGHKLSGGNAQINQIPLGTAAGRRRKARSRGPFRSSGTSSAPRRPGATPLIIRST